MSARFLTAIAVLSAALVCAAYLPADEPATPEAKIEPEQAAVDIAPLGYSVRIEFKMVQPEGTPTFYTHSCGGSFSVNEDISEPNFEHFMKIAGTLSRGDDDGRLLLDYDVQAQHADLNEGFEAVHTATGSALLTPGETMKLTLLGDAALEVTATVDE